MRRNANCTLGSLLFTTFVILLLPLRLAAQSGTVTDDRFLSNNATTPRVNLNAHSVALIVAGSSATVGSTQVGTTKTQFKQLNPVSN